MNRTKDKISAIVLAGVAAACLVCSDRAIAQSYEVPKSGSDVRTDILDALRPIAEWKLGAPIEFVVGELRISGDVAFARVTAQRSGGVEIDLGTTPMVQRDGVELVELDGPRVDALLKRSGRMWVAVLHGVGTTDVWYAQEPFCDVWGEVLPEYCNR